MVVDFYRITVRGVSAIGESNDSNMVVISPDSDSDDSNLGNGGDDNDPKPPKPGPGKYCPHRVQSL